MTVVSNIVEPDDKYRDLIIEMLQLYTESKCQGNTPTDERSFSNSWQCADDHNRPWLMHPAKTKSTKSICCDPVHLNSNDRSQSPGSFLVIHLMFKLHENELCDKEIYFDFVFHFYFVEDS